MSPAARFAWLDLARAVSIALVVLYHTAVGAGGTLVGGSSTEAGSAWRSANLALVPLRMPLFFVVAGVLASNALHRPWRQVVRPRVLDMFWPYVLWSLIFALTAWPRYAPDDPTGYIRGEIAGIFVVAAPYWFIAALPIFFVVTRLGRHHHALLVTAALLVYGCGPLLEQALASAGLSHDVVYGTRKLTTYLLWYVLGYVLRDRILRAGERARPLLGALLVAVFCIMVVKVLPSELPFAVHRGADLLASLSGIAACIALLPALARLPLIARWGALLGSRTLVIYLIHPLVLNVVVVAWRLSNGGFEGPLRDLALVPAVTVLAIVVSLAFDAVVSRTGPRWLLRAPGAPPAAPGTPEGATGLMVVAGRRRRDPRRTPRP